MGFILKIDHFGLLRAKTDNFRFKPEMRERDLKAWSFFEISGFDYVGLDPKSIDYGPLRAENR